MPKNAARIAAATGLLLLGSGCTQYQTPNGPMVGTAPPLSWTFSAGPPSPATAAAAAELGTPLQEPAPAADLSGAYIGTAVVTYNPRHATDCHDYTISGFRVAGRNASFFAFRGTISPAGEVVMQASDKWISGRFVGRSFYGQLWRRHPACTWNLTLSAA